MPDQDDAAARAPHGAHLPRAGTWLRILKAIGLVLIAAWSVLILAWVALHWIILPHIDQWREPIERQASRVVGQPVRIGAVIVTSSGWVPALELKDVALLGADGQPGLRLPSVMAALSPHSLLTLQPRFAQLLIDGAALEVRRDAAGRVFVAGLDLSGPASGDRRLANWFFKQHEFVIRGGSLRWTDELHPAEPLVLTDVQLVVRNTLRRHDLRIDATPPAAWGSRFTVSGQFTQPLLAESSDWKRWRGVLHLSLPAVDVGTLRQHATLPFELDRGQGAVRAWLDVADGRSESMILDVALHDVALRLQPDLEPLVFTEVTGRLSGSRTNQGVMLSARQFGFETGDGVRWPASDLSLSWKERADGSASGGSLDAQRIDLALLAQLMHRLPVGDSLHRTLDEFDPRGTASDLKLTWEGAEAAPPASDVSPPGWVLPPRYRIGANLSGLALAAAAASEPGHPGRPGVRRADVRLEADERGGRAQVAMAQGELDLPGVFEDPRLPLESLAAQLSWRVEAPARPADLPRVSVQVKEARFANADLQGELQGTWSNQPATDGTRPRGPGRLGLLDLEAKLSQGVGTRVARYLPLSLREESRRYVEHAVRGGRLPQVTFRVRGDLAEFPFADPRSAKDSLFRIVAQVEDAEFAYVPSLPATASLPAYTSPWPVLEGLRGELIFDRLSMEIRQAEARLQGVRLSGVQGRIQSLVDHPVLKLDGAGRGQAADVLRFVNASPVGGWIGQALAQGSAAGTAELKLGLTVPLVEPGSTEVRGSVTLLGGDVRLSPDTPLLAAARGRIDFTQQGFSIVGATGRMLGGELSIDGGLQSDGSMRFLGQGTATAEGLRRGSEVGGELLARLGDSLSGQTSYRIALNLVRGRSDLVITSSLVGLASDLPAPLHKSADATLALRYQHGPAPDAGAALRDQVRLDLGSVLQMQYVRDVSGDTPRVLRGGIGVMEPAPQPAQGVAAVLDLANVSLDAWQQAAERLAPAGAGVASGGQATTAVSGSEGYLPTSIGLRAQQLQAGSRRLNRLVAGLSQEGSMWRVNLDADQINGYIEYRPARGASSTNAGSPGRVYARLARLSLPREDEADVESLLDQPAVSVPGLDIVVDDLVLRGKRLGRLEMEAVNRVVGGSRGGPAEAGAARTEVREWQLTRLALTTPEARLSATGNWSAAGLPAPSAADPAARTRPRRVVMDFKLELGDSGALIERLGFGKVVRGGKGGLSGQVAWTGSPLALDYPTLTGQVNLSIAAGQFLNAEPGVGRLLGVLSLQALPRRLLLDFRDVFQQGFAFDDISGDLRIAEGVARTNNLRMRGVQAAVLMDGHADLAQETQDLRVVVVPEINAGTASLAYAAINPALGLASFLAQALLSKPLVAANTREFHVTGPWADPKVEPVERKLTDAVPTIPGPAASAASAPPAAASAPTPADDSKDKP